MEAHMFELKSKSTISQTKFVLVVTFIVCLSACAQNRKTIDADEKRVIPQSEFGPGESWREEYEPPQVASTKESFRSRVKKSNVKSRKSIVASQK
jgi:hypothetical protein